MPLRLFFLFICRHSLPFPPICSLPADPSSPARSDTTNSSPRSLLTTPRETASPRTGFGWCDSGETDVVTLHS
ncbi:hypothetical protein PF003_g39999 [Phytophthora fragariae]|nr:hypothetical protein PF003_g39999 [Phytophthora fragariae]